MKSVFYHKPDSQYDDITGERYHFPKTYLSRVQSSLGNWIVYYGPIEGKKGRFYFGTAEVKSIEKDHSYPNASDSREHYYAYLINYLDFDRDVNYLENGGYEKKLVMPDGKVNGGTAQSAVRNISESEFQAILSAGLSTDPEWPDRVDEVVHPSNLENENLLGLSDQNQPEFVHSSFERPVISQITNRKWRDNKFKQNIRVAYDRTCAFTSLRLINGQGRPEVEAAHIRPVAEGGNDWVRNGIALSGTVHWMFDRGLLSLGDDYSILQSRHLNHDVSHLINKNNKAKVPENPNLRPHPAYVRWHRENIFKN